MSNEPQSDDNTKRLPQWPLAIGAGIGAALGPVMEVAGPNMLLNVAGGVFMGIGGAYGVLRLSDTIRSRHSGPGGSN